MCLTLHKASLNQRQTWCGNIGNLEIHNMCKTGHLSYCMDLNEWCIKITVKSDNSLIQ